MKTNNALKDHERVGAREFRENLSEFVDKVRYYGRPVIVRRNNRDQVALVPLEMLTGRPDKPKKQKSVA